MQVAQMGPKILLTIVETGERLWSVGMFLDKHTETHILQLYNNIDNDTTNLLSDSVANSVLPPNRTWH